MELYQLRTFVIVAEEKNVTKAAKRLFTTPPSVSAHIKALEEEFNVILFERTPKGMKITEKGEYLRNKAEQTLRAAQELANHATRLQEFLIGTLKVGLNATPAFLRVAPLVNALQTRSPGLDLELVASDTGHIVTALETGQLDVGYIFGPVPSAKLISHWLCKGEVRIAAPHPWADQIKGATWPDLAALPWITSSHYCPFQAIMDDLFAQQGMTPRKVVQADSETTKAELVRAGVGVALLEQGEAEVAAEVGAVVIWDTDPIFCDLFWVYPAKKHTDPLIETLTTAVLEVWGTESAAVAS